LLRRKRNNNITSRSSGAATIVVWMFVCIYFTYLKRFFHSFSAIHEWTRKRESSIIIYTHISFFTCRIATKKFQDWTKKNL
jgi:hypothetical protein